jgi:hypothetical protein
MESVLDEAQVPPAHLSRRLQLSCVGESTSPYLTILEALNFAATAIRALRPGQLSLHRNKVFRIRSARSSAVCCPCLPSRASRRQFGSKRPTRVPPSPDCCWQVDCRILSLAAQVRHRTSTSFLARHLASGSTPKACRGIAGQRSPRYSLLKEGRCFPTDFLRDSIHRFTVLCSPSSLSNNTGSNLSYSELMTTFPLARPVLSRSNALGASL